MNKKLAITATLIAALASTLTACGSSGKTPSKAQATPTVTVTASPEDTKGSTSLTDSATTMTVRLTEKAVWRNNVSMQLSNFRRGTSSSSAAPVNTAYLRFTITLTNKSDAVIDTGATDVTCPIGEGEVFDAEKGLNGSADGHLLPGKTTTWETACVFPKSATNAQIEATPYDDGPQGYRTAIFIGKVR